MEYQTNRRKFLGLGLCGLAGLAGLAGCAPSAIQEPIAKSVEIPQKPLTVVALSVCVDRDGKSANSVIDSIEEVLDETHADIIVTPEYSFFDTDRPISITTEHGPFEVDPNKSNPEMYKLIERAVSIARDKHAHLFLGTFCEERPDSKKPLREWNCENTLLHFDARGMLAGICRKSSYYGCEDSLVYKNGKTYRVLPLICAQLTDPCVRGAVLNSGKKYDILVHSLNSGDIALEKLACDIQGIKRFDDDTLRLLRDGFNYFYQGYKGALQDNSVIVVSDGSTNHQGAIIRYDQTAIKNYKRAEKYSVAEID